jgi:hypothetical protein
MALSWTENGGGTETISNTNHSDAFERLVALVEDLCGTASPRYSAEVLTWWFGDKSEPLVMTCGDIWEWTD